MQKWEYKILFGAVLKVERQMNEFGAKGWELAWVYANIFNCVVVMTRGSQAAASS